MYKVIALAFLMLFIDLAHAAEPFDFKGVPLGASEEELVAKIVLEECTYSSGGFHCTNSGRLTCRATPGFSSSDRERSIGPVPKTHAAPTLKYGGVSVSNCSFRFIDDRLMYISLTFSSFEQMSLVIDALTEKYGKAQILRRETFHTRVGTPLTGNYLEWKKGGTTIIVRQFDPIFIGSRSEVQYSLDSYSPLVKQRNKQNIKENAKDL